MATDIDRLPKAEKEGLRKEMKESDINGDKRIDANEMALIIRETAAALRYVNNRDSCTKEEASRPITPEILARAEIIFRQSDLKGLRDLFDSDMAKSLFPKGIVTITEHDVSPLTPIHLERMSRCGKKRDL